jgi:hypothetical protein
MFGFAISYPPKTIAIAMLLPIVIPPRFASPVAAVLPLVPPFAIGTTKLEAKDVVVTVF